MTDRIGLNCAHRSDATDLTDPTCDPNVGHTQQMDDHICALVHVCRRKWPAALAYLAAGRLLFGVIPLT